MSEKSIHQKESRLEICRSKISSNDTRPRFCHPHRRPYTICRIGQKTTGKTSTRKSGTIALWFINVSRRLINSGLRFQPSDYYQLRQEAQFFIRINIQVNLERLPGPYLRCHQLQPIFSPIDQCNLRERKYRRPFFLFKALGIGMMLVMKRI
jgi:hypothetical protein